MPLHLFGISKRITLIFKCAAAIVLMQLAFARCQSGTGKSEESNTAIKKDTVKTTKPALPQILDTGQVYFSVSITKNDTPWMAYKGEWPLLLTSNNFYTLQLIESKNLMSISNMLTLYLYGLPGGQVPIVASGNKAGDVSMIMSPVINGSYDIPILPTEGFLNITKNTGKIISGNFEARAVDGNNDKFLVSGVFLNVEVHDSEKIK